MGQVVNNETLLKEAYPLVRSVRPSIEGSVHVEIIGDLVPDEPVHVIKLWYPSTLESLASFFAVSARSEEEAMLKYMDYCNTEGSGSYVDEDCYNVWVAVNPKIVDEYTKFGKWYFETACFKIKEYTLKDFVVEYCRVM